MHIEKITLHCTKIGTLGNYKKITQLMVNKKISKIEMSRRMGKSRSALDRLLDPQNSSVSLKTLDKAALSRGRRLDIQLV